MGGLVRVEQPADQISHDDRDLRVERHRDCIYSPLILGNFWDNREWGVYGADGRLLEAAAFRTEAGAALSGQSAVYPGDMSDIPYAPGNTYFYTGMFLPHYGHFLCSSLARSWALCNIDLQSVSLLGHSAGNPAHWFNGANFIPTLFGAAGVSRHDFAYFDHPVRLRELVVAQPSFVEKNIGHPFHARAGRAIGDRLVKTLEMPVNREIVYLSKASYTANAGFITNEAELCTEIDRLGVPIISPESLSLAEQISLFRSVKRIVGPCGSAFHTLMFAPQTHEQITVQLTLSYGMYSTNHALMDNATKARSYYVWAEGYIYQPTEGAPHRLDLVNPKAAARDLLDYAMSLSH